MKEEGKRQKKFSSLIQKDLSAIFQKDTKWTFGDKVYFTVTEVRTSPDLRVAKVFLSIMMADPRENTAAKRNEMIELVNLKKKEIRGILGNKIGKSVRVIPELIFYLDESVDYADHIQSLLDNLEIPPEEDDEENT